MYRMIIRDGFSVLLLLGNGITIKYLLDMGFFLCSMNNRENCVSGCYLMNLNVALFRSCLLRLWTLLLIEYYAGLDKKHERQWHIYRFEF